MRLFCYVTYQSPSFQNTSPVVGFRMRIVSLQWLYDVGSHWFSYSFHYANLHAKSLRNLLHLLIIILVGCAHDEPSLRALQDSISMGMDDFMLPKNIFMVPVSSNYSLCHSIPYHIRIRESEGSSSPQSNSCT